MLQKFFIDHQDKFDDEYKRKLFEFNQQESTRELMSKYDRSSGQAKINYLALNRKSQKKINNAYFKEETSV